MGGLAWGCLLLDIPLVGNLTPRYSFPKSSPPCTRKERRTNRERRQRNQRDADHQNKPAYTHTKLWQSLGKAWRTAAEKGLGDLQMGKGTGCLVESWVPGSKDAQGAVSASQASQPSFALVVWV